MLEGQARGVQAHAAERIAATPVGPIPDDRMAGGEIVAEGSPELITQTPGSYTGKFLAEILPKTNGKR